jgi:prepilin-type N-terminal cleavage/methylation domain-containing protein
MLLARGAWGRTTVVAWRRPEGFTLLEVIVVVALLALAAAAVQPALWSSGAGPDETLARVVARAREAAVRRAESMRLRVEASGRWDVRPAPPGDSLVVAADSLRQTLATAFILDISPLGVCVPRAGIDRRTWDAIDCREVIR